MATVIWGAEVLLGLLFSVIVAWVGFRRYRQAESRAGKILSAGSIAGGLLGVIGFTLLISAAGVAIYAPDCAPTSTLEYCEQRTARIRTLLVYGIFPVVLLVGVPLLVDSLAKRSFRDEKKTSKELRTLANKQDADLEISKRLEDKIDEIGEQSAQDRADLNASEDAKATRRKTLEDKQDEDLNISRRLDKDRRSDG